MTMHRITRIALGALLAVGLPATGTAHAQEELVTLQVGDAAPAFEATADNGKVWRSRDHVGKKLLVLYFYPAAMTGGCTKQACMFRDDRTRLTQMGAEVVGVSGDRVEGLKAFKGANRLNFPLLSDASGNLARAFGVPTKEGGSLTRVIDGKEVTLVRDLTTARWTFIIGRDGKILYKDTAVNAEGDSKAVIAAIQRLSAR
jgi:peroxiredoxin Q/BCP